jgi:hypothetical protein
MILVDIKNPRGCFECPCLWADSDYDVASCEITKKSLNYWKIYNDNVDFKDKDCPLIEISKEQILPSIEDKSNELQINDDWDGSGD